VTAPPSLDVPEVAEFIAANHRAFLFCRDRDGHPVGYAMRSVAYRAASRSLYFATYTASAKVRHLIAAPDVACLIGDCERWDSARGVARVRRPSGAEVDELITADSPDERVPDSVVTTVRERLLSGKRSFIVTTLSEICAADLAHGRA
jgi:hypothetical protein